MPAKKNVLERILTGYRDTPRGLEVRAAQAQR
jgi:hypothetical protein